MGGETKGDNDYADWIVDSSGPLLAFFASAWIILELRFLKMRLFLDMYDLIDIANTVIEPINRITDETLWNSFSVGTVLLPVPFLMMAVSELVCNFQIHIVIVSRRRQSDITKPAFS